MDGLDETPIRSRLPVAGQETAGKLELGDTKEGAREATDGQKQTIYQHLGWDDYDMDDLA
jgi:hypothetical protein